MHEVLVARKLNKHLREKEAEVLNPLCRHLRQLNGTLKVFMYVRGGPIVHRDQAFQRFGNPEKPQQA
jgi:hypothetical protein